MPDPDTHKGSEAAAETASARGSSDRGDSRRAFFSRRLLPSAFSHAAFMRGLIVVILFYAALAAWLALTADATRTQQQAKLSTQTVLVERSSEDFATPLPLEDDDRAVSVGEYLPDSASDAQIADADADVIDDMSNDVDGGVHDLSLGGPESPADAPFTPEDETALAVVPPTDTIPAATQPTEAVVPSSLALPDVPVPGLLEKTEHGDLPVVRDSDSLSSFQAYRRPFNRDAAGTPFISLGVVDIGLSHTDSESALRALPPEVSFAVSPYADDPAFWVREARKAGHEAWLILPLESKDYPKTDPGMHSLIISAPERENQAKLTWLMSQTTGYAGFIASENPAFLQSASDMRPIVNTIYRRGLGLIDTSQPPSVAAQNIAYGLKAPYASIDLWIDATAGEKEIAAALARLEAIARERGSAAALMHTLPVSYQEVARWAQSLPEKGIALAPLSAQTGL